MFFRTQRTLSENILMIFDPLPVKFLPQKKLLIWAKNSPIFCSKLPRSQKWRYQKFLLHQKMVKEGSKNQKNFIFSKSIFERWKKQILGPLGPFLAKIDFWWHVGDSRSSPPLPPVTVTRLRPIFYFIWEKLGEHFTRKVLLGVNFTTSKIT